MAHNPPHTSDLSGSCSCALLQAVTSVLEGTVSSALAVVRPPGHHAECDRAMGGSGGGGWVGLWRCAAACECGPVCLLSCVRARTLYVYTLYVHTHARMHACMHARANAHTCTRACARARTSTQRPPPPCPPPPAGFCFFNNVAIAALTALTLPGQYLPPCSAMAGDHHGNQAWGLAV